MECVRALIFTSDATCIRRVAAVHPHDADAGPPKSAKTQGEPENCWSSTERQTWANPLLVFRLSTRPFCLFIASAPFQCCPFLGPLTWMLRSREAQRRSNVGSCCKLLLGQQQMRGLYFREALTAFEVLRPVLRRSEGDQCWSLKNDVSYQRDVWAWNGELELHALAVFSHILDQWAIMSSSYFRKYLTFWLTQAGTEFLFVSSLVLKYINSNLEPKISELVSEFIDYIPNFHRLWVSHGPWTTEPMTENMLTWDKRKSLKLSNSEGDEEMGKEEKLHIKWNFEERLTGRCSEFSTSSI